MGDVRYVKRTAPAEVRRLLAVRHGCIPGGSVIVECHYCGTPGEITWFTQIRGKGWVAFGIMEMDHFHPESLGGETSDKNLVLACRRCNRSKGHKTLREWADGAKNSA